MNCYNDTTISPEGSPSVGYDIVYTFNDTFSTPPFSVHGFEKSLYEVEEGNRVNVTFKEEVKGESNYDTLILPLMGVIKSQAVTAGDYVVFLFLLFLDVVFVLCRSRIRL